MNPAAVAGLWMAAVGAALVGVGLARFLPRALRVRRRTRELAERFGREVGQMGVELVRLRDGWAEIKYRSRGWRTAYRWASGPLAFGFGQRAWIRRHRGRAAQAADRAAARTVG